MREAALVIPRSLMLLRDRVEAGERSVATLLDAARVLLGTRPEVEVEYLTVVDPNTLEPLDRLEGEARALIAARAGSTRLIDTIDLTTGRSDRSLAP